MLSAGAGGRSGSTGSGGNSSVTPTAGAPGGGPGSAGAGGVSTHASGNGGALPGGSAGAAGAATSMTAGTSFGPPLAVDPVDTWGGAPLGMVPYATSGSRLAAIGYTDGGAVFFDTMRDLTLGTDCAFQRDSAGDWLCSPKKTQSLIYLDAACTEPAVEEPAFTSPTGQVFGSYDDSTASSGGSDTVLAPEHVPVYRVADELFASDGTTTFAEDTLSLYTLSGTHCEGPLVADRKVVVSPPSIFRATPVSDSELVKANVREVPLNSGLTLERLVTDDGAQLSGNLASAGRECELQDDGICVPAPVAELNLYADPACTEYAFRLSTAPAAGEVIYGVDAITDGTTRVYELTPTTTLYEQLTSVNIVMMNGQPTPVVTVTGCQSIDVSSASTPCYRRTRDVTAEMPKLDSVQLGSAQLFPAWFYGVVSANGSRVQVQIDSPDKDWVRPNILVTGGSVCSVYDDRYQDECLMKDGLSNVPVTEVNL